MNKRPGPTWFQLAGLGTTSALCLLAGVGGGYLIAASTRTGAAVIFAGLAFGIVAAVAATYFMIKRYL